MSDRLILASASPQRKTLLQGLCVEFSVIPSDLDESACAEKEPRKRADVLAVLKAQDVARKHPGAWVIGCDTLVVAPDGTLLEKPVDAADAERMIRLQSGGTSLVHSGLCLIGPAGTQLHDVSTSFVEFHQLTDADVAWWIQEGLWKGRSGSFQIDGKGQLLISRIEGDWTSIVGLPVYMLGRLMEQAGARFFR